MTINKEQKKALTSFEDMELKCSLIVNSRALGRKVGFDYPIDIKPTKKYGGFVIKFDDKPIALVKNSGKIFLNPSLENSDCEMVSTAFKSIDRKAGQIAGSMEQEGGLKIALSAIQGFGNANTNPSRSTKIAAATLAVGMMIEADLGRRGGEESMNAGEGSAKASVKGSKTQETRRRSMVEMVLSERASAEEREGRY